MTAEKLADMVAPGPSCRFWPATVTAVTTNPNTLSADPHDGAVVTLVPWIGTLPLIGDEVLLLLADRQLIAISAGRP